MNAPGLTVSGFSPDGSGGQRHAYANRGQGIAILAGDSRLLGGRVGTNVLEGAARRAVGQVERREQEMLGAGLAPLVPQRIGLGLGAQGLDRGHVGDTRLDATEHAEIS